MDAGTTFYRSRKSLFGFPNFAGPLTCRRSTFVGFEMMERKSQMKGFYRVKHDISVACPALASQIRRCLKLLDNENSARDMSNDCEQSARTYYLLHFN